LADNFNRLQFRLTENLLDFPKLNQTAQNISDAIAAVAGMNSLGSLTTAQLQAKASALIK
jgi:hypothetical protein